MTNSPIWFPSVEDKENSCLARFLKFIELKCNLKFADYEALHSWSVREDDLFWELFVRFQELSYEGSLTPVRVPIASVRGFDWFPQLKINVGLTFLRGMREDRPIVEVDAQLNRKSVSKKEIEEKSKALAWKLRTLNLSPSTAIVSITQNDRHAVVSYIGCLLEGIPWCGLSTNVMPENLKYKIDQVQPEFVICDDTTVEFASSLNIPYLNLNQFFLTSPNCPASIDFKSHPFSTLSSLLFTSGTTGSSKAYFHDSGAYFNQLKDLSLHFDIREKDVLLLSSNPGWMTWNWLITSLSLGARLVIANFDWPKHLKFYYSLVQDESVTVFCTSPFFLRQSSVAQTPRIEQATVRSIISTGGPLEKELFHHGQALFGNIQVGSVSGGSDLNSAFVGANPLLPVFSGEIQCKCLALDVDFVSLPDEPNGKLKELVCKNKFPCMPAGTLVGNLEDELKKNYYFGQSDDFWHHGDLGYFTVNGGLVITSRFDNTLKPKGFRINPLDYYDFFSGHPEVADCLVTSFYEKSENHIVLFLKSSENETELKNRIEKEILGKLGSFYLPRYIIAISEIPYSTNKKREETAVKRLLQDFFDGVPLPDLKSYSQVNACLLFECVQKLQAMRSSPKT